LHRQIFYIPVRRVIRNTFVRFILIVLLFTHPDLLK
jgi:hypothetical protein